MPTSNDEEAQHDFYNGIDAWAAAHPDGMPDVVAAEWVATLTAEERKGFLVAFAVTGVKHWQRARARNLELEAQAAARREAEERTRAEWQAGAEARSEEERRYRAEAPARKAAQEQAKREAFQQRQDELREEMERYRDNPYPHKSVTVHERTKRAEFVLHFKAWMGDEFDDWYVEVVEEIAARGSRVPLDQFRLQWEPDFEKPAYMDSMFGVLTQAMDDVRQAARLELTREFLETEFALGDGVRVTWGSASVEHHQQRIAMLTHHAAGTLETAERHHAAVAMLSESGARCLNDVAVAPITAS